MERFFKTWLDFFIFICGAALIVIGVAFLPPAVLGQGGQSVNLRLVLIFLCTGACLIFISLKSQQKNKEKK